jgi:hypothetical protein
MRRFWRRRRGLYLSRLQCFNSSSHLQGLSHRHLYCWTLDLMIQMIRSQYKTNCLLFQLSFICHFVILADFSCVWIISCFLGQNILSGKSSPF